MSRFPSDEVKRKAVEAVLAAPRAEACMTLRRGQVDDALKYFSKGRDAFRRSRAAAHRAEPSSRMSWGECERRIVLGGSSARRRRPTAS